MLSHSALGWPGGSAALSGKDRGLSYIIYYGEKKKFVNNVHLHTHAHTEWTKPVLKVRPLWI